MPFLRCDGATGAILSSRCVASVMRTAIGVYEVVLAYPREADVWAADVTVGDAWATASPGKAGRWTIRTYELPETPADKLFLAHWYPGHRSDGANEQQKGCD